jgi:glycosyltransferase involved in cell wall biosynthesis
MTPDTADVALYFDPDGYVEQLGPPARPAAGAPLGLMGRQVAGKEFLDAYLAHGRWDTLTAVVSSRGRADPLVRLCREHPSSRARQRRLRVVEESGFLAPGGAAARVLHLPHPPDGRFAWARHAAGAAFALSGVTHTLASAGAANALCELVAAPFEPFDALVCTSRAVADMVRAVTGSYCDYLGERFGGNPALRLRLETIPLGVNPEKFRPPAPEERTARRRALGVADDEVMVLSVGRLSHHAKAHPFPVFHAADQAARRTGRKVHLVMAGWAASPAIAEAFRGGARYFAPAARVSFADGQDPAVRAGVWPAADVFVSLPDNVQETFGLVVVEAMASGLPVVGSDWDGYRDLVADGETGLLVPTRMVRGATAGSTGRLLFGGVNYDHFLAEVSQAAAVDPAAAADAMTRLVADDGLRRRMGEAGRRRAVERFAWEHVVRAYESLWAEQQRELAKGSPAAPPGPVRYPAPERSFAGYPTAWLDDASTVRAADGATAVLAPLLNMPLTGTAAERRCRDPQAVADVLRAAAGPRSVGELAAALERAGAGPEAARATIAWLLKYGLLRADGVTSPGGA